MYEKCHGGHVYTEYNMYVEISTCRENQMTLHGIMSSLMKRLHNLDLALFEEEHVPLPCCFWKYENSPLKQGATFN